MPWGKNEYAIWAVQLFHSWKNSDSLELLGVDCVGGDSMSVSKYVFCFAPKKKSTMCDEHIKVIDLMEIFTNKITLK